MKRSFISMFFALVFLSSMVISFCGALRDPSQVPLEIATDIEDIENSEESERPFGESESEDSKSNESKSEGDEFLSSYQSRIFSTSVLSELKYIKQQMIFKKLFLEIPNPPPQV